MTFFALFLAAFSGATFNFAYRKSLDGGGRANVFLMLQCFFASMIMIFLNVKTSNFFMIDMATVNLGVIEGILYLGMMGLLAKAFQRGPPGLTIATMNSAAIIPAILMAVFFGADFGHGYTLWNGVGSALVILGLFLAARGTSSFAGSKVLWMIYVVAVFSFHSIYLSLFQWRALLLKEFDLPRLAFTLSPEHSHWFQPIIFLSAGIILLAFYLFQDRRPLTRREILWSSLGGTGNGLCTFGLVWASEIAQAGEKAMIFPIAGVISILLCTLWGKWLYKEQVNWKGSALCLSGIVLGTVDWATLLSK